MSNIITYKDHNGEWKTSGKFCYGCFCGIGNYKSSVEWCREKFGGSEWAPDGKSGNYILKTSWGVVFADELASQGYFVFDNVDNYTEFMLMWV